MWHFLVDSFKERGLLGLCRDGWPSHWIDRVDIASSAVLDVMLLIVVFATIVLVAAMCHHLGVRCY